VGGWLIILIKSGIINRLEDFSFYDRGMELCSIEDAFPKITGDTNQQNELNPHRAIDSHPSKEERRAARKKAKKCKGPALEYLNAQEGIAPDPDRPAVKRMGDVPAFVSYEDAFPDISGSIEGFSVPKLASTNCLPNTEGLPAYFLRGDDDEEGFANFSGIEGENPAYQLSPASIPSFDSKGVDKAAGLPAPVTNMDWKPTTASKVKTAYVDKIPPVISSNATDSKTSGQVPLASTVKREASVVNDQRDMLVKQIEELQKRIDQLEHKEQPRNNQKELLMFVGTGIFLLISFDIALRSSR